jgi:hypothetical protein
MAALQGSLDFVLDDQLKTTYLVRECGKFVWGILVTFRPGMKFD